MPMEGKTPVAKAEMLIRRAAEEVFEAIADPAVTAKFWFTEGSGRLEAGRTVRWVWGMYGVSAEVRVKEVSRGERILLEWEEAYGYSEVEWTFVRRSAEETFVTVTNRGFQGDPDEVVAQALDSTGGFTMVLCGLKAYLEHGIELNLVADKAPDANVPGWRN